MQDLAYGDFYDDDLSKNELTILFQSSYPNFKRASFFFSFFLSFWNHSRKLNGYLNDATIRLIKKLAVGENGLIRISI